MVADNYPDIGSKGIPEDVFHALSAEFARKLPFKMAYWVSLRACLLHIGRLCAWVCPLAFHTKN